MHVNNAIGATAAISNRDLFIIGGDSTDKSFLKITKHSLDSLSSVQAYVNTKGACGRKYASALSINANMLIVGGVPLESSVDYAAVVHVSESVFGIDCRQSSEESLNRYGHSMCLFGHSDRAVLFGGKRFQNGQETLNDLWMYRANATLATTDAVASENAQWLLMETDAALSPGPAPRAFHGAVVVGDKNQYLFVIGGQGEHQSTPNDCWIADLTAYLTDASPEKQEEKPVDPKLAKKQSTKGGVAPTTPSKPMVQWFPVKDPQQITTALWSHSHRTTPSSMQCVALGPWTVGVVGVGERYDLWTLNMERVGDEFLVTTATAHSAASLMSQAAHELLQHPPASSIVASNTSVVATEHRQYVVVWGGLSLDGAPATALPVAILDAATAPADSADRSWEAGFSERLLSYEKEQWARRLEARLSSLDDSLAAKELFHRTVTFPSEGKYTGAIGYFIWHKQSPGNRLWVENWTQLCKYPEAKMQLSKELLGPEEDRFASGSGDWLFQMIRHGSGTCWGLNQTVYEVRNDSHCLNLGV